MIKGFKVHTALLNRLLYHRGKGGKILLHIGGCKGIPFRWHKTTSIWSICKNTAIMQKAEWSAVIEIVAINMVIDNRETICYPTSN